jgi:hypothetical protein
MNELVQRLSTGRHPVTANRPDKNPAALKERIDLGYLHILFNETGTEIGIQLDRSRCDFSKADFATGEGKVYVEGCITLNYEKIRCVAEVALSDMQGEGYVRTVSDEEYRSVMNK